MIWVVERGAVTSRTAGGLPEWVIGTQIDVTERRERENALRTSERFLERAGQMAGVGGWEVDLATGALQWSAETFRIHGLPPDHQPNVAEAIDFYAPEARPLIRAAVERGMAGGDDWDLELPFIRADGSRLWVRAVGSVTFEGGKPMRMTGAFQDVTDRVAARVALESANQRMKLAADSGRIGIWEWDVTTSLATWDAWTCRVYGIPPQDPVTYEMWRALVHPEDFAATAAQLSLTVAGGPAYDTEFRIIQPGGDVRHVHTTGRVEYDATGQAVRVVGANWDVTEQRRLAAELLQRAEQQAHAAERELAILRTIPDVLFTVTVVGMSRFGEFRLRELQPRS